MAAIQRRTDQTGRTTFRVQVRLKGHPAQTATFERLTDAKRWAAATETAIREGRYFAGTEGKRRTLADALNRYEAARTLPATKAQQLAWWRDKLGAYALADITAARIIECRDELLGTKFQRPSQKSEHLRTPATCNRYTAALSHVLTVAAREWYWIDQNPAAKVKKLKEPPGRVRYLDDDERARLLEACKASRTECLYPIVVLALSTGARYNELLTLEWRQVDLKAAAIYLERTKNGDRRRLPLKGLALELIKAYSKVRRLDTPLVFPGRTNPDTGETKPIDLRHIFRRAVERAEIENFTFHDLRHSCASYLAMNGTSLAAIAEILGHRDLKVTRRYTHLSDGHVSDEIERMNARLFDDTGKG